MADAILLDRGFRHRLMRIVQKNNERKIRVTGNHRHPQDAKTT